MQFTKRKFLGLPETQQHKKCSELLRLIYENDDAKLLRHYNEIQEWMEGIPLPCGSAEVVSNRFHVHLKHAGVSLSEHRLLPRITKTDGDAPRQPPSEVCIYLDNIRSAHNVGSILRTVEAFALGKVYFSPQTPFIDHLQVRNTSMGAYQHVCCEVDGTLEKAPRPLIVLETSPQAVPLFDYLFPETFTLAVGNEEYGCSREVLQRADALVEIPLKGRKNSLNVANAFAIAAAEITRQHQRLTHAR